MNVFLSYHTPDRIVAEKLAQALIKHDDRLEVFLAPWALRPGAYWIPELATAIQQADAFLLLLGRAGPGRWQLLEYYEALDRKAKQPEFPLVPLLIETAQPKIPFVNFVHWIQAADPTVPTVLHQLLFALRGESLAPIAKPWLVHNPYKGLEALTEADAEFFYGRTELTGAILSRIAHGERCLTLVGNSGVGKSSLVRAGIIAALRRQRWPGKSDAAWPVKLQESRAWLFLTITPGVQPVYGLARAFVSQWEKSEDPLHADLTDKWTAKLLDKPDLPKLLEATADKVQELGTPPPRRFVLFIDQGEELYTQSQPAQARAFTELLVQGGAHADVLILNTLRSDYYGRLQDDEILFRATARVDVEPVREEGIREIVVNPASALKVSFDPPDLTGDIVREAAEEPGALPLLSFLMEDMWKRLQQRQDGVLRWQDYRDLSGVKGVVQRRADDYLNQYTGQPEKDDAHRETVKRVFTLRLLHVPQEGEPVRRRVRRQDCTEAEWAVIEELAGNDWRLVTTGEERGEATAQVAHEVMVRTWEQLKQWINEERTFLVWKGQIEQASRVWAEKGEDGGALLRGAVLVEAERWLLQRGPDLREPERHYLQRSLDRRQQDIQEQRDREQQELLQARRLAEEASKREEAERARADEQTHRLQAQKQAACLLFAIGVLLMVAAWMGKEGMNVQYATSIVLARLQIIKVSEPEMVSIRGGTFQQGDVLGKDGESDLAVPTVTLKPFAIGKFEVTFEEYDAYATWTGRQLPPDEGWGRDKRPVINVSWQDAVAFAKWLSQTTGKSYRLPTEKEWKYAATSGINIEQWVGTSREEELTDYAWYAANSDSKTHAVGEKKPNNVGLYDMSGNVWEWVQDCFEKVKEDKCSVRVILGGAWLNLPVSLRASNRSGDHADYEYSFIGFRLAEDLPP